MPQGPISRQQARVLLDQLAGALEDAGIHEELDALVMADVAGGKPTVRSRYREDRADAVERFAKRWGLDTPYLTAWLRDHLVRRAERLAWDGPLRKRRLGLVLRPDDEQPDALGLVRLTWEGLKRPAGDQPAGAGTSRLTVSPNFEHDNPDVVVVRADMNKDGFVEAVRKAAGEFWDAEVRQKVHAHPEHAPALQSFSAQLARVREYVAWRLVSRPGSKHVARNAALKYLEFWEPETRSALAGAGDEALQANARLSEVSVGLLDRAEQVRRRLKQIVVEPERGHHDA